MKVTVLKLLHVEYQKSANYKAQFVSCGAVRFGLGAEKSEYVEGKTKTKTVKTLHHKTK